MLAIKDWQNPASYQALDTENASIWAWQFLRRNLDYQRDFTAFMHTWNVLEQDYGTVGKRDFQAWKRDPRAHIAAKLSDFPHNPPDDNCTLDDEHLLIECWMGSKWGFYKFPLDPALESRATSSTAPTAD